MSGLKSVNVAGAVITLSDKINILSATLHANLMLALHSKVLSSSCFYHIHSFRQICSSLDNRTAVSVASALISSCLDQFNSILYGMSLKHTACLQPIQRSVAQVVLHHQYRTYPLSSNELFKQLHWLPIDFFAVSTVQKLLISVKIWQSCSQMYTATFYETWQKCRLIFPGKVRT